MQTLAGERCLLNGKRQQAKPNFGMGISKGTLKEKYMFNFHKILKTIGEEGEGNGKLASPTASPKPALTRQEINGSPSRKKGKQQILKPPAPVVKS